MAKKHIITAPDGTRHVISAPDDATPDQIVAYAKEQFAPSKLESAGRGAVQGLTFGFGDEIYGAAKGAYDKVAGSGDFAGTYTKERDAVRAANERASEANPWSYGLGEVGGAVAVPFGMVGAGAKTAQAANASLGARSLSAAGQGAGYGAAYGLGTAEGDLGEQAMSTLGGAVAGGVVGGALPGAVALASSAVRAPGQMARVVTKPESVAAEKFAEARSRDLGRETLNTSRNPVAQDLARLDAEKAAGRSGQMLADMGGENTQNLVRSAVNMPNTRAERFNQVLNRRQAVQTRELERAVSKGVGAGEDFYGTVGQIIERRDKMAEPMFRTAFSIETPITPKLTSVLERPTMKKLFEDVQRRMADEGHQFDGKRTTEIFHRIKLELDEQIGLSKQAEKMGNRPTQGYDTRTLTVLKNDFLNAIDNKSYKYALKQYAGPSALKNAADDGMKEALAEAPEQLTAKLAKMTKGEADMWRMGAARALMDRIRQGNIMRDRTKSIFDTPDIQLRLKAIFPDNKARGEFMRTLAAERRKNRTRQAAQGNSTTAKQLTQAQEAGKSARTVADIAGAATGRLDPLLRTLERGANFASGITPKVAAEILDLAMAQGGAGAASKSSRAIQEAFERGLARKARQGQAVDALLPAQGVFAADFGKSSPYGR
jgi:alkylhydroperoxidase/carboxymuconolactone decarboxylase family protein YurZ